MNKWLLYLGVLLIGPRLAEAQVVQKETPGPIVSYFTLDYQPTDATDTTALCVETTFRDSLSGITRAYYPSGKLKQYVSYSDAVRGIRYGTATTWYEDGQMESKEDYVRGARHGDLLLYYPNGILKRREQCQNGQCGIGGICYAADGSPVPYFPYEQLPLYPGGQMQLLKELTKGLRLTTAEWGVARAQLYRTPEMLRPNFRFEVDVELAVDAAGRIANARVVRSTAGFLNSAALRAVTNLQRQFVAGRRDGHVMTSYLTVPLLYNLNEPYSVHSNGSYRRPLR